MSRPVDLSKLEALYGLLEWAGTYEAGTYYGPVPFTTLQSAISGGASQEVLDEFPPDLVAGYRLLLRQIDAERHRIAIRRAEADVAQRNPHATPAQVRASVAKAVRENPLALTPYTP